MLTHENEEMKERVIALEKKVHEQEDELLCLKSALSDVIRRLSAVEANRCMYLLHLYILLLLSLKVQPLFIL